MNVDSNQLKSGSSRKAILFGVLLFYFGSLVAGFTLSSIYIEILRSQGLSDKEIFNNVVGQDSLTRFDQPKRRSKRRNKNKGSGRNRNQNRNRKKGGNKNQDRRHKNNA